MFWLLWLSHITLAIFFIGSGVSQLFSDYHELTNQYLWLRGCAPIFIKIKGLVELISAFGLLIPPQSSFYPSLNLISAFGISLMMLGVILTKLTFGGEGSWKTSLILFFLATFVSYTHLHKSAWTRLKPNSQD